MWSTLHCASFLRGSEHLNSCLCYLLLKVFSVFFNFMLFFFPAGEIVKNWCSMIRTKCPSIVVVVWSLSHDQLFVTPWTAAHHASLSFTISQFAQLMFIELVMPSNHLILCPPFFFCPQAFPAFGSSNELTLRTRCSKYWSFCFSISPSNEHSRLISFRIDWFHLLAKLMLYNKTGISTYCCFIAKLCPTLLRPHGL